MAAVLLPCRLLSSLCESEGVSGQVALCEAAVRSSGNSTHQHTLGPQWQSADLQHSAEYLDAQTGLLRTVLQLVLAVVKSSSHGTSNVQQLR